MSEKDDKPQPGTDKSLSSTANSRGSTLPSTGLIESAIANISDDKKRELQEKAAEESIDLEKKRIELGVEREHIDERTRSTINAAYAYQKMDDDQGGRFTTRRYTINEEINTGSGKRKIEVKSGPQCFIATACFGRDSEEVYLLKRWRDQSLRKSYIGRRFIGWYYGVGPTLSQYLKRHPIVRTTVKASLRGVVGVLKLLGFDDAALRSTPHR